MYLKSAKLLHKDCCKKLERSQNILNSFKEICDFSPIELIIRQHYLNIETMLHNNLAKVGLILIFLILSHFKQQSLLMLMMIST